MSDTVLTSVHLRPTLTLVKILGLSCYLTTTLNDYINESSYKILILVTCEDRSYTRCRATRYIRRRVIAHLSNHRDRDTGRQTVSTSGSHGELVGFFSSSKMSDCSRIWPFSNWVSVWVPNKTIYSFWIPTFCAWEYDHVSKGIFVSGLLGERKTMFSLLHRMKK